MRQLALDALGVAGLAALVEGVREIYPPAALILGGLALVAVALLKSGPR